MIKVNYSIVYGNISRRESCDRRSFIWRKGSAAAPGEGHEPEGTGPGGGPFA